MDDLNDLPCLPNGNPWYREQFQRMEQMVGTHGIERLRTATVTVVGLGAVGGYAVEALARAGIGRLRLIDYDIIKPSNINRQILALWSTVGRKKCELAVERVREINPACHVVPFDLFVHADTIDQVLADDSGMVIDAIDSLNPKTELMAALELRKIKAVSSMGAALRSDPARIAVGRLDEVTHCRLAMLLRKRLRRRGIVPTFPCVYSPEPVRERWRSAVLPPELSEENYYAKGRRRSSLGSLPTLPGIFGLTVANTVILMLLDQIKNSCTGQALPMVADSGHSPPETGI